MPTTEEDTKGQFARVFLSSDSKLFKDMAEVYFRQAVFLRTKDLDHVLRRRLLVRNCQKRLFLGVGTELLLKAIYLHGGFSINEFSRGQNGTPTFPFRFSTVEGFRQESSKTFMLDRLITGLGVVLGQRVSDETERGLKIAKVFRNKEGHVVLPQHTADDSSYRAIESALVDLYRRTFEKELTVRISFRRNERGVWSLG